MHEHMTVNWYYCRVLWSHTYRKQYSWLGNSTNIYMQTSFVQKKQRLTLYEKQKRIFRNVENCATLYWWSSLGNVVCRLHSWNKTTEGERHLIQPTWSSSDRFCSVTAIPAAHNFHGNQLHSGTSYWGLLPCHERKNTTSAVIGDRALKCDHEFTCSYGLKLSRNGCSQQPRRWRGASTGNKANVSGGLFRIESRLRTTMTQRKRASKTPSKASVNLTAPPATGLLKNNNTSSQRGSGQTWTIVTKT